MKIIITALFIAVFAVSLSAQVKDDKLSGFYSELGYTVMIYTNSDVSNIYPAFNFRVSSFNSEISLAIGYKISDMVSVEFAPSMIYSKSGGSNGFYYSDPVSSVRKYYVPSPPYLFALPLNAKVKVFPFIKSKSLFTQGIFFSAAAGPMFIHEEYDNYIYPDDSQNNLENIKSYNNNLWAPNAQLTIGFRGGRQVTYGFEAGYRFVPLAIKADYPMVTSIASNMNSVILSIKLGYNF